jgi:hypothetical protein
VQALGPQQRERFLAGVEVGRHVGAARAIEVGMPKDKPFVPLGR